MVIKHILGEGIDFQKVAKMTSAVELETSEVKALIAALTFIVSNSAKYNVEDDIIRNELQQFGLPKEHCDSIARAFSGAKELLQEHFVEKTFTLPKLVSIDWKVNYVMCNDQEDVNEPAVQLKIGVEDNEQTDNFSFELDQDKFNVLLGELKQARAIMENM
uniref:COMM domain-containing protein n=1 Tax=Vannella robusta TaxID=1487602 RepID=A0A7S4HP09_9EUKA|mmetsp:Transcript_13567/g.17087  ORF Transcript_13567/g.17087 Transcript_13567/m.17087 type:complete len:161 (+) Transcript_13567:149-631(+)